MTVPKQSSKKVLIGIAFLSFSISFIGAFYLYTHFFVRTNVLGAQYVTRLKKENYTISQVGSFLGFYEPEPGRSVTDSAYWVPEPVTYTINQDTLNERFDYPIQKAPHTFRIMTIGDSFTFGQYVNTAQNFSEVLEDLFNTTTQCPVHSHFDVINLGVSGYDIGYTVQRFIKRGIKYHPDLVVWFINAHNLLQLRDLVTAREKQIDQSLTATYSVNSFMKGNFYSASVEATREIYNELGKATILKQQEIYLNAFSQNYSGPLLIASPFIDDPDSLALINQFATSRPLTWVDREFPDLTQIHGEYPDHHPNVYGHTVIADGIFSKISALKLYPCSQ